MAMKLRDWLPGSTPEDVRLFRRGMRWLGRKYKRPDVYRNLKAEMADESLSPEQKRKLATKVAFFEYCISIAAGHRSVH